MTLAPARRTALRVLGRVRRDSAFSGPTLARELSSAGLSADDRALATRLVYGVLGAEGLLDEVLDRHLERSLEPRVRDALRLAVYELLFGRVPSYAVVDQAVTAVRSLRAQAAPLANAVLRAVAAEASGFPWGDPATDRTALARATAHPMWIVDELYGSLGEDHAREALTSPAEPPPTFIRLDPFAADTASTRTALCDAELTPSPPDPDCFRALRPSALFAGSRDHRGWFAMDAGAQMAPALCRPGPGLHVLEVGAGRGNKTICLQAIASRAGGTARITALEAHRGKADGLRARLRESAVPCVDVVVGDGTQADALVGSGTFDVAFVDAPCTGLGTLRRYPEKRWRLRPEDVERLHGLQTALLAAAARTVKPDGRVVYSTCSVARRENDDVVDEFLGGAEGIDFTIEPVREFVPDQWRTFCDARGWFRSWPTDEGPDGHFVAVLRRSGT